MNDAVTKPADDPTNHEAAPPPSRVARFAWVRKLGVAGFVFFLLKGLAWLVVPALVVRKAIE